MADQFVEDKMGVYRIKYIAFNKIGKLTALDNTNLSLNKDGGEEYLLNAWNKKPVIRYKLDGNSKISFQYEFKKSMEIANFLQIPNGDFTRVSEKSDELAPLKLGLLDTSDPTGKIVHRVWNDISVTAEESGFQNGQWIMVDWTIFIRGFGQLL